MAPHVYQYEATTAFLNDPPDGLRLDQYAAYVRDTRRAQSEWLQFPPWDMDLGDRVVSRPTLKDVSFLAVTEGAATSYTINCENGNVYVLTLSANTTFQFQYWPASGSYGEVAVITKHNGTAVCNWPAGIDWGGDEPDPVNVSGKATLWIFWTTDGGTTVHGGMRTGYTA